MRRFKLTELLVLKCLYGLGDFCGFVLSVLCGKK